MPSTFGQIETLKQQLAEVSAHLAEVKSRAWEAKKSLLNAQLQAAYCRIALALRKPQKQYSMWSTGVLTIGPVTLMLIILILSVVSGLSGGLTFGFAVLAGVIAFVMLNALMRYPATDILPQMFADDCLLVQESGEKAKQLALEVVTLRKQQVAVKAALRELIDEDHRKREELLKRDWKPMRDHVWKLYIGEVFATLGAEVVTPENTEDGTVDYIVTYGPMRIAVVARGNVVAVTNKDVKTAVAGKIKFDCDRATVMTNSRLANSALEEAEVSSCILIGVKDFPAFVMGSSLELFR